MSGSSKSRVFWSDVDVWNNRWYVSVGTPLFAGLGGGIGTTLSESFSPTVAGDALSVGLTVAVALLVGLTALAYLDHRA